MAELGLAKAPCGGERAGPSPVDRRKGGLKRSVASNGHGIPLGIATAGANRHDSPLLAPPCKPPAASWITSWPQDRTCHLDRGYDSTVTRQLLDELGFDGEIARKGVPAPSQAGTRWVVERTHAWMNGYGKLRRCTERNAKIVDFYLYLAAALVTIRQLIQRARALPLGHPPRPPTAQVTPIARHSKPGMPSSRVAGQRSEAMVLRLAQRSHEVVHDRGWAFIAADAGSAGPSALVDDD